MSRGGTQAAPKQRLEHEQQTSNKVAGGEFSLVVPSGQVDWDRGMSAAGASLLQSWLWGEFKKQAGWSPLRLALRNADASIKQPLMAAQVLFRSFPRIPLPLSVAYIPRGPVFMSGYNTQAEAEDAFWKGVHKAAKKRGAIFLKVEPNIELDDAITKASISSKMQALGFRPSGRLQPARTMVLDIGGSEDDILRAMKPKTRYNLRLAGRRGVVVRPAKTLEDIGLFYNLLEVTGERDEFGIHTLPYYTQMWQMFGPEGENSALILLAEHPDEQERAAGPIGGLLVLRFGREAIYMYGASANRGREHMPNYLLQWEAIKWARSQGCTVYDFWGIPDAPSDNEAETETVSGGDKETVSPINARSGLRGVYWFKKGFGGREIEYPGAYDYVYNPVAYKLWMRWRGANLG